MDTSEMAVHDADAQPGGAGEAGTPILPAHIEGTVEATAKLHADHQREAGTLQRLVDRLTSSIGRPRFIAGFTVITLAWVAGNVLASGFGLKAWDEPPLAWLQGAIGLLALYVTVLILTTPAAGRSAGRTSRTAYAGARDPR